MKKNVSTRSVTTHTHMLRLDKEELLSALNAAGYQIPHGCEITVRVPGGGDWSNTSLDISGNSPVTITWQTVEEKTDG